MGGVTTRAAKARTTVATLVLAGAAAIGCGDDDDAGAFGLDDSGQMPDGLPSELPADLSEAELGEDSPSDLDLCSLLETAEVEAELGHRGTVTDGYLDGTRCVWDVGDLLDTTWGTVALSELPSAPGMSAEEYFDRSREDYVDPVDVEGVGDEAYYAVDTEYSEVAVFIRVGETMVLLNGFFANDLEDVREPLVALAGRVAGRL